MLTNYIKVAFRRLLRHRLFSMVNILGLSLGISSCMFILIYVGFEQNFDNFRPAGIYRVVYHGYEHGVETGKSAQVVPALAPAFESELTGVVSSTRVAHTDPFMSDPVMQVGGKSFRESRIYFADSSFLAMMEYPVVSGSAITALDRPDEVALSATMARKYFGTTDAVGRTMIFHMGDRGTTELKVTSVFNDVPANSHLHTDFIVSLSTLHLEIDNDWDWGNFYTYIRLDSKSDAASVQDGITKLLENHVGKRIEDWAKEGYTFRFTLQAIRSIHLDSHLWGEAEPNSNRSQVNAMGFIGMLILVIGWVNYVNFTIARSTEQVKEVGVRKIAGSNKWQLISQFLTDAAIVNIFSVSLSIVIIQTFLPSLSLLTNLPVLPIRPWHFLALALIAVTGTLFSGIYPSYVILKHRTVSLLKGKGYTPAFGLGLSKGLVVFQFCIAIILIVATITVYRQLNFMQNADTGIDMDRTLVVYGPGVKDSTYRNHLNYFKAQVQQVSGVKEMAVSSSIPGQELEWGREFSRPEDPQNSAGIQIVAVDPTFLEMYSADFVGGHNFLSEAPDQSDKVILNETATRALGVANPKELVGKSIIWDEGDQKIRKEVIGVVKDFHQESVKKKIEPMIFALRKFLYAPWANEYYSFRLSAGNSEAVIMNIKKEWASVFPGNPFDYFFLDDFYGSQYKDERQFGKVFNLFSGLSIVIACLGLFGLSTFVAIRRTKEIGVRKVLGASTIGIIRLLSGSFVLWVVIAFTIATPVAWYLMGRWLQQFPLRVSITPWTFAVAGTATLMVALFTVGWQSVRAAIRNPAESLKYE